MSLLQSICAQSARLLHAPVAWIGVPEQDGERVLASVGSDRTGIPASWSFASFAAAAGDAVVVPDASSDPRLASHPLVCSVPGIRMVAPVPLLASGGEMLGVLTVISRNARQATPEEIDLLRLFGRAAARELETAEQLSEAEDRFRDFFDHATDHIVSVAPDGRVLHANEFAVATLGLEPGLRLASAVDPHRRLEFEEKLGMALLSGNPERVETVFRTVSGENVTLEGWLRPKLIDRRPVLVRVVFRDVTDRKQFEAELGNARDAALASARAKNHFLANVSHEIRTPMNGIVGMIDLLLATRLDAEQSDFAHQARTSAEQLLSLVNNMLYISDLEAGGLAASRVDFDPRRMLQRIIDVERIAALGKDVEIGAVIDETVPAILRGNQSRLRQVITNLLDNAVKFTDRGSIMLSVAVQTETATHRVIRFEVRDTGCGIGEEERLWLFERFTQLDDSSTRRFHGAGLGLATARHLVETMGGLIDVESEPGRGSAFWFSLPFAKSQPESRPIPTSEFDLRNVRVLLLDRQRTSRKLIRHYLKASWEMRVDLVENGTAALAALKAAADEDPYRLVLFDEDPAAPDATSFARTLRSDPRMEGVRLMLLADDSRSVNEEALRAAGVNAWVARPPGARELLDALVIALSPEAAKAPQRERAVAGQSVTPESPVDIKDLRVLLAEDNFLNMKLTMTQLQKLGCSADVAANGKELLDAIGRKRYDIVLMDCQMPIVDGYEATIEIRKRETKEKEHRHWIVAMTANALEGDREKCLAAGMDDYLAKPTHHDDLTRALRRAARLVVRDR